MADPARRTHPSAAWCGMVIVLLLPALALGWSPLDPLQADPLHAALMWTRETAWSQPWRGWTAAWVHGSAQHLAGNVLGAVLVALLGVAAQVSTRQAWAWAAAWPLTQLSLTLDPRLQAYGGLSGVLHAGVAVVGVGLLQRSGWRGLGMALLLGLLVKVLGEAPWRVAMVDAPMLGIAVVPLAHLAGVLWGALWGASLGLLLATPAGRSHVNRSGPAGSE